MVGIGSSCGLSGFNNFDGSSRCVDGIWDNGSKVGISGIGLRESGFNNQVVHAVDLDSSSDGNGLRTNSNLISNIEQTNRVYGNERRGSLIITTTGKRRRKEEKLLK